MSESGYLLTHVPERERALRNLASLASPRWLAALITIWGRK
ncbi:MAG: hypothetical protein ABSE49_05595 [Polyangiaceae bacterium]|jgi:hypothetical protein